MGSSVREFVALVIDRLIVVAVAPRERHRDTEVMTIDASYAAA
jgi:hypothetical protein